jgi:hypothetical protein
MIRSYYHLQEPIHISQSIMTGVRFRGFRLTQLCSISCSLFYSDSQLHDSVVRPSSKANTYITKYHDWREFQGFPSNATLFQELFTILFPFCATLFGRTTIFKEQIYTSQIIMTGVRFRVFRLIQLCFNSCSLFYSNSPLHDSVVRPFSSANIYITIYHDWRELQGFPSNATLFQ